MASGLPVLVSEGILSGVGSYILWDPPMSVGGVGWGEQIQTIESCASAPDTERFRPPADQSVHHTVHTCSHNSGPCDRPGICFVLLNAFRWQCAASNKPKCRLFDWSGDDRRCWTGRSLSLQVMTQVEWVELEIAWRLLGAGARRTREIKAFERDTHDLTARSGSFWRRLCWGISRFFLLECII